MPILTRNELIERIGSVDIAARFFSVSRQAIYDWPEERPIPKGRLWELMARLPEVFGDGPFPIQAANLKFDEMMRGASATPSTEHAQVAR